MDTIAELEAMPDHKLAAMTATSADAQAVLASRYLNLIRYHANRFAPTREDAEDLIQEGMMTLLHAASRFREDRGTSFSVFASACIVNRMRTLVRQQNSTQVADLTEEIEEHPELTDPDTPESIFLEKENYTRCCMQVMAMLSEREWEILQCIMSGASYARTAEMLEISEKSVDNAMQRVRRKMRAIKSTLYYE
ncbi:MAG: sigma-70 family RNA polymerase sigma factor [Oscillospiraceae bacterium]|nr:sigma-70 family RNA polymerase sigma factor [Ruminococcus sp.]MBQ7013315.1 sigma-70 family RNA polymerase sigma factor [Oscillospiraceae bacterium]